jgi:hypothetical protein
MEQKNLQRMIRLAAEFFDAKNDPAQISIDDESMRKLRQIHPASLSEETDRDGPIAWVLVIPTTRELMEQFIAKTISERELLDRTSLHGPYDALYLCSALVLPEHRGMGFAKRQTMKAITAIRKEHPITSLFCWAFSVEGQNLAASVARESGLPLHWRGTD